MTTPPHIATETDLAREAKRKATLQAEQDKVRALTVRLKHTERAIRNLITSKALTDAQRDDFLGLLTGTRSGKVEPKHAGYSKAEERLVKNFRAMDGTRRRCVTLLFHYLGTKGRK